MRCCVFSVLDPLKQCISPVRCLVVLVTWSCLKPRQCAEPEPLRFIVLSSVCVDVLQGLYRPVMNTAVLPLSMDDLHRRGSVPATTLPSPGLTRVHVCPQDRRQRQEAPPAPAQTWEPSTCPPTWPEAIRKRYGASPAGSVKG